jgi:dTDP-glucose 4,6-dehydratase/UDP-glucuronate decarboxylase
LLEQGDTVIVIDNYITGWPHNLADQLSNSRLTIVEGDVSSKTALSLAGMGFDRIYHLASPASPVGYGRHPLETLQVNSVGTWNLLDLARDNGARFLVTSTSEVYGEPQVHPQHEKYWGNVNPIGPRSCYDEGKRFTESLTVTYGRQYDLDFRIARLFNTYGPRMDPNDGRVIPNFCSQALRGEPLTIYGDGSQTRSLCYVSDTVAALHSLMESPGQSGEVFNLGNPDEYTVEEIAEKILLLSGRRSSLRYRPLPIDDPTRRCPDITKAVQRLGWRPTVTLQDGLIQTLDAFQHLSSLEEASKAGTGLAVRERSQ